MKSPIYEQRLRVCLHKLKSTSRPTERRDWLASAIVYEHLLSCDKAHSHAVKGEQCRELEYITGSGRIENVGG